jgi:murein DD-endopeptidase MepM/ murein hydrolase activator NlpD
MAGSIVDDFGFENGRQHLGIDIAGPVGTSVSAAGVGVVVEAVKDGSATGGYGNLVVIDHGGGIRTYYAHLSTVQVSAGERVDQGQIIGAVGMTGSSSAPHLHLEVRVDGQPTDPRDHLPG